MKFGVKTYFEEKFLDHFIADSDFFEVQGIRSKDYKFLKKYNKPIVVHAEHFSQGSNVADKSNRRNNLASIKKAINISDMIRGGKIVLHPGKINDKNCSKETAIEFIKKVEDYRILLENMPNYGNRLCTLPEEMKEFMEKTGKGFIFDLAHCMVTANRLEMNQEKLIKEFLRLKPKHFHISGQNKKAVNDQHRALIECDLNWKKILSWYPKNAEITLEVTSNIKKTEKDLKMIKKVARSI